MADDIIFDFEKDLVDQGTAEDVGVPEMPVGDIGQQPRNFVRNYRKTVCAFWVKGMCMKGDQCGFLHKYDQEKMPACHTMLKKGKCADPDCKFKHTFEDIKECNMYALGFCIFGPDCRYKHTRRAGPIPDPSLLEAAKPKQFRDVNRVVNSVNENVATNDDESAMKRPKYSQHMKTILPAPTPSAPRPRPPPTAPPPLPGQQSHNAPQNGPPSGPGGNFPPPFSGRPPHGPPFGHPRPPPSGPMQPASLPPPFHGASGTLPPPIQPGAGGQLPPPFSKPFQGNNNFHMPYT